MKSTTTYEMQNYEANQASSIGRLALHNNESTVLNTNNSGSEKYSLRQRQKPRIAPTESLTVAADSSGYLSDDNSDDQEYTTTDDLRKVTTKSKAKKPITRKKSCAHNSNSYSTTPTATSTPAKAKTKAAPLSKYRRKTANARERTRMREINSAFENLRHCVPHSITGDESVQSSEKLTKITTLRLAMKYIRILSEALTNPSFEADFLLECKRDGDHRFTTHNWQQQPLVQSAQSDDYDDVEELLDMERESEPELPKLPTTKTKSIKSSTRAKATKKSAQHATDDSISTNAPGNTRKAPAKRLSKKQKLQQSVSPYSSHSSAASTCSSNSSIASTSAYASLSSAASSIAASSPPCSSASNSSSYLLDSPVNSAYINNVHQSLSDLSSLMLESDGESLHLSEPCLSPSNYRLLGANCATSTATSSLALFNAHAQQPTTDGLNPYEQACDQHNLTMSSLENPLELSLRLLDSSGDTLDFSTDATTTAGAPSTCLSPLGALDSFNPFVDLLHSDFPEQSALDLFLT